MKKIMIFNKVLGLVLLPLVFLFSVMGVEKTPKLELLYYPQLIGFSNNFKTVTEGQIEFVCFVLVILQIIMTFRYIRFLGTLTETSTWDVAKDSSENFSNVVDIITAYFFIQLVLGSGYMGDPYSYLAGFTAFIIFVVFIIYKISEINSSTEGVTRGALNLRETLKDYYEELESFENYKKDLVGNYKRLIG